MRVSLKIHDIILPDEESQKKDREAVKQLINDPIADPDWEKKWVKDEKGNVFELYYVGGIPDWHDPNERTGFITGSK